MPRKRCNPDILQVQYLEGRIAFEEKVSELLRLGDAMARAKQRRWKELQEEATRRGRPMRVRAK